MLIVLIGSAAGITQIASRKKPPVRPAPAPEAPRQSLDTARIQRERDEAMRQLRELRAKVAAERTAEKHQDAKCIGGVVFATVDGELRNVGTCR
ncbi:hypothetical protein [Thermomonas fusca]|uniref:hypothetical protein n=1 Tax=Thermomonas fusca TaxID=215690 RepID=UPI0003FE14CE|nr:hypothetical protein [Thermomonas fusca]